MPYQTKQADSAATFLSSPPTPPIGGVPQNWSEHIENGIRVHVYNERSDTWCSFDFDNSDFEYPSEYDSSSSWDSGDDDDCPETP